ncbi:MAG: YihA family ribosome biogenesis GTP-binding protein [Verrucomicrobia bacterium]|nr:YihA family ribosome biogenesis GTP-binding protein [Verrucomicrobiota bacterium]
MNISSAIFECSAPDLASCPDESLPEFAFIGRSNVGKSSLLNMLAGQDGLARVSPTPGFTKLINFFVMNRTWRLVDLPGYGYAKIARKDKALFNRAVNDYLRRRPNLCCVFALIDSGLPPQPIDLEFVEWLTSNAVPYVLVFTKTDSRKPAEVQANIAAFQERIAGWFEKPPEVFRCSSATRNGRSDLLGIIESTLKAGPAEPETEPMPNDLPPTVDEAEPPLGLRVRAGNEQAKSTKGKKWSKMTRPW